MRIEILQSGSSGNCYIIDDGVTTLMIEAGLSIKQFKKKTRTKLADIDAILVSHEHGDHSKYVYEYIRKSIDCWMYDTTADHLELSGHRIHCFKLNGSFSIGSYKIVQMPLNHDVPCFGFLIYSNMGEKLVYISDTSRIDYTFQDVDYYMVETSYKASILEENISTGISTPDYAKRLRNAHMELETAKAFFGQTCLKKTKQIYLLHLSDKNSDAEIFETEIQKITGVPVVAC